MRPRVSYGTFLLGFVLGLLGFVVWVYADPATHKLPDQSRQRQVWFGDLATGYVVSGCTPSVPGALTLGAFACEGYVKDTTTGELLYAAQAAAAVGPLNSGNGTYWLALSRDTSTSHSGWTRQGGTQYLWRLSATLPATTTGLLIVSQITVAGGTITAVSSVSGPAGLPLAKVYGGGQVVSVMAAGAKCDGTTDDTIAIERAIASNQTTIIPPGVVCIVNGATVSGKTNFRITGGGALKHKPGANLNTSTLYITNSTNFEVDHIECDGNKANLTESNSANFTYNCIHVNGVNSSNGRIHHNFVHDVFYGVGIMISRPQAITSPETFGRHEITDNTLMDGGLAVPTSPAFYASSTGILAACDDCIVSRNVIYRFRSEGIDLDSSNNCKVTDNVIIGDTSVAKDVRTITGIGIFINYNCLIANNTIAWTQQGISNLIPAGHEADVAYISRRILIQGNVITDMESTDLGDCINSIYTTGHDFAVHNNLLVRCGRRGIAMVPTESTIIGNRIHTTGNYGIFALGANSRVSQNYIDAPGSDGIHIAASGIVVDNNTIANASVGINYDANTSVDFNNRFVNVSGSAVAGDNNVVPAQARGGITVQNQHAIGSYKTDGTTVWNMLFLDGGNRTTLDANSLPLGLSTIPAATTVGAAGPGDALPATPEGYFRWTPDSGTTVYKTPFYKD